MDASLTYTHPEEKVPHAERFRGSLAEAVSKLLTIRSSRCESSHSFFDRFELPGRSKSFERTHVRCYSLRESSAATPLSSPTSCAPRQKHAKDRPVPNRWTHPVYVAATSEDAPVTHLSLNPNLTNAGHAASVSRVDVRGNDVFDLQTYQCRARLPKGSSDDGAALPRDRGQPSGWEERLRVLLDF